MGKPKKGKKKGKGAEKTAMKTDKKQAAKQKKMLEKLGEADIAEVVAKLEAEEARLQTIVVQPCMPPSPRSSFTLVAHPEKQELILFGGEFYNGQRVCVYNDLYFYNITKNDWKHVHSPPGPAARSGHQMVALPNDGGQLWLFGGEHASPSQLQFYHYKDLWMMTLKTRKWEKVNAANGPSARSGHRMVASKRNLIVFGGFHDNNQSFTYYNDVHVFSLDTYTWQQVEVSGAIQPNPRSACCMAAGPDGKIFIWGGYSKASVKKDVQRGVTHTDMFALIPDKSSPSSKFKWSTVKPGGYKLPPRNSIGCTTAPNGKSYCFGGVMDIDENDEDVCGHFGDDVLALDLVTLSWRLLVIAEKTKLVIKDDKSTTTKTGDVDMNIDGRTGDQTASVTCDGTFTVTIGGAGSSKSITPAVPKVPSFFPKRKLRSVPSPRMNPGLCVCKGTLYLFGGVVEEEDRQYTFNDFYALDLHKMDEWKVLIPNNWNAHDWIDSDSSSDSDEDDNDDNDDNDDSSSDSDEDEGAGTSDNSDMDTE